MLENRTICMGSIRPTKLTAAAVDNWGYVYEGERALWYYAV